MNPALCHAESRIHKISLRSLVIGGGGGGGGHSGFDSVKLRVVINFSLSHNVLCFTFVVVFYSMHGLCPIIKVVFLNERDCDV